MFLRHHRLNLSLGRWHHRQHTNQRCLQPPASKRYASATFRGSCRSLCPWKCCHSTGRVYHRQPELTRVVAVTICWNCQIRRCPVGQRRRRRDAWTPDHNASRVPLERKMCSPGRHGAVGCLHLVKTTVRSPVPRLMSQSRCRLRTSLPVLQRGRVAELMLKLKS